MSQMQSPSIQPWSAKAELSSLPSRPLPTNPSFASSWVERAGAGEKRPTFWSEKSSLDRGRSTGLDLEATVREPFGRELWVLEGIVVTPSSSSQTSPHSKLV